jgi:hypothetical protein
MARFHDLIVNSGRMPRLAALAMGQQPFDRMMALSRDLFSRFERVHSIPLEALFDGVLQWLRDDPEANGFDLQRQALADYRACGAQGRLSFMQRGLSLTSSRRAGTATPPRQARHLGTSNDLPAPPIDSAGPAVL